MKVFKLNDCDWVAAETLYQAKLCLAKTLAEGLVTKEFEEEFIVDPKELNDHELETLKFTEEDGTKVTFKEQLVKMISTGEKFPAFFASTEF